MTGRHRDEHGEPDGGVLLDGIPDREGAKDPDSRAAGGVTVLDLHGHLPRAEPVGVDGKLDGVAPHRDAEPGRLARGERFRQHQPVLFCPVGRILRVELCPFGEFAAVCQYTPVEAEDDLERGERRPAGVAEGAVDRQHRVRGESDGADPGQRDRDRQRSGRARRRRRGEDHRCRHRRRQHEEGRQHPPHAGGRWRDADHRWRDADRCPGAGSHALSASIADASRAIFRSLGKARRAVSSPRGTQATSMASWSGSFSMVSSAPRGLEQVVVDESCAPDGPRPRTSSRWCRASRGRAR